MKCINRPILTSVLKPPQLEKTLSQIMCGQIGVSGRDARNHVTVASRHESANVCTTSQNQNARANRLNTESAILLLVLIGPIGWSGNQGRGRFCSGQKISHKLSLLNLGASSEHIKVVSIKSLSKRMKPSKA